MLGAWADRWAGPLEQILPQKVCECKQALVLEIQCQKGASCLHARVSGDSHFSDQSRQTNGLASGI